MQGNANEQHRLDVVKIYVSRWGSNGITRIAPTETEALANRNCDDEAEMHSSNHTGVDMNSRFPRRHARLIDMTTTVCTLAAVLKVVTAEIAGL